MHKDREYWVHFCVYLWIPMAIGSSIISGLGAWSVHIPEKAEQQRVCSARNDGRISWQQRLNEHTLPSRVPAS